MSLNVGDCVTILDLFINIDFVKDTDYSFLLRSICTLSALKSNCERTLMLRPDPSFWGRHFIVRQEVATCTGKLVPFSVTLAVFDFGIHTKYLS